MKTVHKGDWVHWYDKVGIVEGVDASGVYALVRFPTFFPFPELRSVRVADLKKHKTKKKEVTVETHAEAKF